MSNRVSIDKEKLATVLAYLTNHAPEGEWDLREWHLCMGILMAAQRSNEAEWVDRKAEPHVTREELAEAVNTLQSAIDQEHQDRMDWTMDRLQEHVRSRHPMQRRKKDANCDTCLGRLVSDGMVIVCDMRCEREEPHPK